MASAIIFPGQGAQYIGMGKDLAEAFPECRALFDRAGAVLGYDLADIAFNGPIEKLTISTHTQPAIFVHSVAAVTAWKLQNPGATWDFAAGHSIGEWTALHVAGAVGFEDAVRALKFRAQFMQEAAEARPGAMLAILGAERATIDQLVARSGAQAANFNSHEQVVLSGTREAIDRAEALSKDLGIRKAIRLPVAGAFHSDLMRPAADRLAALIADVPFQDPVIPVISNVTARLHADPVTIKRLMIEQIYSSVRWCECIEWLKTQGVSSYLECGPGKVLTGLVRRIDKAATCHSIQDRSGLQAPVGA
jgi:[acyl-carrier-protein] S-malonyltransferase